MRKVCRETHAYDNVENNNIELIVVVVLVVVVVLTAIKLQ